MVRSRTKSEEIEARLTTAALHVLSTEGEGGLSIRRVAALADVAPMGIYARFSSKAGLIDHLLSMGFRALREAIDVRRATPGETLTASGIAYRDFALSNPDLYRLMFARRASSLHHEPSPDVMVDAFAAFQTLVGQVEDLQRELDATDRPAVDVAMMFWSTVHGFVDLELEEKNFSESREENFATLVRVTLMGIRAELGGTSSL
jgi:AcrR family transcriptional regulator